MVCEVACPTWVCPQPQGMSGQEVGLLMTEAHVSVCLLSFPSSSSSTFCHLHMLSLHLWGPPGLTTKHPTEVREVLAQLHEEAQLLAELSDQAAAVTWLKDGQALPPGPKYKVQASAGQRALLVRDVARDDAGLYECVSRGGRIAYHLSVQGECVHVLLATAMAIAFCTLTLGRL